MLVCFYLITFYIFQTNAIKCYVGSNTTNELQSSTFYAPFHTCQIITQKCPYPLPGHLCGGPISIGKEIPVDTITFYSGEASDCVGVRNAFKNVEWPVFDLRCCSFDLCNAPGGVLDLPTKTYNSVPTSVVDTGNGQTASDNGNGLLNLFGNDANKICYGGVGLLSLLSTLLSY